MINCKRDWIQFPGIHAKILKRDALISSPPNQENLSAHLSTQKQAKTLHLQKVMHRGNLKRSPEERLQENFSRVLVSGRWASQATVTLAIVLKQLSNSYEDWGSQLQPLVWLCPCLSMQDRNPTAARGDLLPQRDMQAYPIHRGKDSGVVKFWLASL